MQRRLGLWIVLAFLFAACSDGGGSSASLESTQACDDEPFLRTTADGLEFVRTPDSCFEDLAAWPYQTRYVELDGLRQAYVEEGVSDGPVVLLLHGQPAGAAAFCICGCGIKSRSSLDRD